MTATSGGPAALQAVRLGLHRGWTEFMLSLRSSQDQWFYLFTAFLAVGYLYLRRDTRSTTRVSCCRPWPCRASWPGSSRSAW